MTSSLQRTPPTLCSSPGSTRAPAPRAWRRPTASASASTRWVGEGCWEGGQEVGRPALSHARSALPTAAVTSHTRLPLAMHVLYSLAAALWQEQQSGRPVCEARRQLPAPTHGGWVGGWCGWAAAQQTCCLPALSCPPPVCVGGSMSGQAATQAYPAVNTCPPICLPAARPPASLQALIVPPGTVVPRNYEVVYENSQMCGRGGCWAGAGCWALGAGRWALGAGRWALGAGCWVLGTAVLACPPAWPSCCLFEPQPRT